MADRHHSGSDAATPATLTDWLRHWAAEVPERVAIDFYGAVTTYRELDAQSERLARYLRAQGLAAGARVAVFLPNCPHAVVAFHAILRARCVYVPVNVMSRAAELEYELDDSEAQALITTESLSEVVAAVRPATAARLTSVLVTRLADQLPATPVLPLHAGMVEAPAVGAIDGRGAGTELAAVLRSDHPPFPGVARASDLAVLNYTGGTTGLPKGCEHTQAHLLSTASTLARDTGPYSHADVFLSYTPLSWIAGELYGMVLPAFLGSTCVLLTRWDPAVALRAIDLHGITAMTGTTETYLQMLDAPTAERTDLSTLRVPLVSSFVQRLTPDIRNQWKAFAGEQSLLREAAYGLTESNGPLTSTLGLQANDVDLLSENVCCGRPVPGVELRIVEPETGRSQPANRQGEIQVRTDALMTAYWRRPEATRAVMSDGFLRTGDTGMLDEAGCLHFVGRSKDMLKVNGMSVSPSEVESILGRHHSVANCAVVGRADDHVGERPVAFVQLRDPGSIDVEALSQWCRANMAVYKVPELRLIDKLPLTVSGKVRRNDLRDRLTTGSDCSSGARG